MYIHASLLLMPDELSGKTWWWQWRGMRGEQGCRGGGHSRGSVGLEGLVLRSCIVPGRQGDLPIHVGPLMPQARAGLAI